VGAKLALEVNSADITSKPVHDSQVVVMFHQEKQVTFCVQYKVLMSTLVGLYPTIFSRGAGGYLSLTNRLLTLNTPKLNKQLATRPKPGRPW
jgi:hypothetical protein